MQAFMYFIVLSLQCAIFERMDTYVGMVALASWAGLSVSIAQARLFSGPVAVGLGLVTKGSQLILYYFRE